MIPDKTINKIARAVNKLSFKDTNSVLADYMGLKSKVSKHSRDKFTFSIVTFGETSTVFYSSMLQKVCLPYVRLDSI